MFHNGRYAALSCGLIAIFLYSRSSSSNSSSVSLRPLLAQSGHAELHCTCPLSGVKRTCLFTLQMSANDPKRTSCIAAKVFEPLRCRRLSFGGGHAATRVHHALRRRSGGVALSGTRAAVRPDPPHRRAPKTAARRPG